MTGGKLLVDNTGSKGVVLQWKQLNQIFNVGVHQSAFSMGALRF